MFVSFDITNVRRCVAPIRFDSIQFNWQLSPGFSYSYSCFRGYCSRSQECSRTDQCKRTREYFSSIVRRADVRQTRGEERLGLQAPERRASRARARRTWQLRLGVRAGVAAAFGHDDQRGLRLLWRLVRARVRQLVALHGGVRRARLHGRPEFRVSGVPSPVLPCYALLLVNLDNLGTTTPHALFILNHFSHF